MTPIKVLTATARFDGHDVSVNLFRRLMQKRGAEVVHLGHNRSVREVVRAAVQEDVDALLVSSYQGGHNEYFRFLVDSLRGEGAGDVMVFGGGGGVILPSEIRDLEGCGVTRLYHAVDGQKMGVDGIVDDIFQRISSHRENREKAAISHITEELVGRNRGGSHLDVARQISYFENQPGDSGGLLCARDIYARHDLGRTTVLGVTGTGGSGKSSLIDELVGRFLSFTDGLRIGVLAVDPTKSTTGGALLGDRIRYNRIEDDRVYFRSMATRESDHELSLAVGDAISVLKSCGYQIVFVETSGIGQGDHGVPSVSDRSLYVMTAEYGAPSQLEKIDMLDLADFIVINKAEKRGAEDALREVRIHYLRSRQVGAPHGTSLDDLRLPVYAVCSNRFNDPGVNRLFQDLLEPVAEKIGDGGGIHHERVEKLPVGFSHETGLLDHRRANYLSDIAEAVSDYRDRARKEAELAGEAQALKVASALVGGRKRPKDLDTLFRSRWGSLSGEVRRFLDGWEEKAREYRRDRVSYSVQGKELSVPLHSVSLSGLKVPKIALPAYTSWPELVRYFYLENLPGEFPYTAGVFPFKRTTEDPKRQFAGEGGPGRTNRRFHYLCRDERAKRLSVAFDGITLYGENPSTDPDVYGKIGESGVSVCTVDDMDALLQGFDPADPLTSVSMTINAPAPVMTAFYFATAYKRELARAEASGARLSPEEKDAFRLEVFRKLRGTVQADMLKEDQGQNTCIFSIDFAMKLIGDMQEYLSLNGIRNYYSLSVSGYHIAEAGANPVTQLAFTLANGFTYVEYFLKRGIAVDDFAPNMSFFFSNGMDPEYSVIGRVARRVWAVAMKSRYGASEKSCKLKYHIQTSGRSLHAQNIDFNDVRTTLQGLLAFYDNCNSLHTNSYDEAVTTPTEESVRRSMAIQLILSNEFGMLKNENPHQGAFVVEWLTDAVEAAVLEEFHRLSRRGGVLGAMEMQYQRSRIQQESMHYEHLKQTGEHPVIGVNRFVDEQAGNSYDRMAVTRATDEEKRGRIRDLRAFEERHAAEAGPALARLKDVALSGGNVFEEILRAVEHVSMGRITRLLYEIGGQYRRGM